jgi:hypothetical protein
MVDRCPSKFHRRRRLDLDRPIRSGGRCRALGWNLEAFRETVATGWIAQALARRVTGVKPGLGSARARATQGSLSGHRG